VIDQEVGERLKRLRLLHKLSQRQLAKKSGVANATISQIESHSINPTVSLLKRVLDGFPVSLSEFFVGKFETREQIFYRQNELMEIGEGGVSFRQVGAKIPDKKIQFLHERYLPGKGTGRHPLSHEGEECGLVLSGFMEVQAGHESRILGPGDAYYSRPEK